MKKMRKEQFIPRRTGNGDARTEDKHVKRAKPARLDRENMAAGCQVRHDRLSRLTITTGRSVPYNRVRGTRLLNIILLLYTPICGIFSIRQTLLHLEPPKLSEDKVQLGLELR